MSSTTHQRVIYSWRRAGVAATPARRDIERIVALHRRGALKLDELVSGVYPLEEINEAIKAVKQGEAIRNVIAMRPLDVA